MRQTKQQTNTQEICTATRDGWRLWRTLDASGEVEYALSAQKCNARTMRVMAQAMASLLSGMPVAAGVGSKTDDSIAAHAAAAALAEDCADSRLMARASGKMFVALLEDGDHAAAIEKLLELMRTHKDAGVRLAAYRQTASGEADFNGLFNGSADLELTFSCAKQPILHIRFGERAICAGEIWSRLRGSWLTAIAS